MESDLKPARGREEEENPGGGPAPGVEGGQSQGIEGGVEGAAKRTPPQASGSYEPLATALPLELLKERFFRWDRSRYDLEGAVRRVLRVDPDCDLGLLHHTPEA